MFLLQRDIFVYILILANKIMMLFKSFYDNPIIYLNFVSLV